MSIYVGNLAYSVSEADLKEVFAEYGSVTRVQLPVDRETGRARGFGFVEMSADEEEVAAIEALDGAEWMGRQMRVNKARPRDNSGRKSRGSGDSRGQGGPNWNQPQSF
ncbi:MAG: RNA recognition motif domain-containing protein [Prochlorotrichaceae cyanobacterium]|jgi:RNA recognition motif-containing protein